MNEVETENEKPLLVVKYRLAHKLFEMMLIYPWLILIGGGFIVKGTSKNPPQIMISADSIK